MPKWNFHFEHSQESELPPKNAGPCAKPKCQEPAHARKLCARHYRQRERSSGNKRCQFEECRNHQDDGMRRGAGRRLCREHEHLHLIEHPKDPSRNAAVEQSNMDMLAAGIKVEGKCWVFTGQSISPSGYPLMFTHNSGGVQWLAHRVAWDLLMGGHKPRRELDHLTACRGAGCVNPAHMDPVTATINQRRRVARRRWREDGEPYRVKECGPRVNREAAQNPRVVWFADRYGLPLPVV